MRMTVIIRCELYNVKGFRYQISRSNKSEQSGAAHRTSAFQGVTAIFCHYFFRIVHRAFIPTFNAICLNCLYYRRGIRANCLPVEDVGNDLFWIYLLYMAASILYQYNPHVFGHGGPVWQELGSRECLRSPYDKRWLL